MQQSLRKVFALMVALTMLTLAGCGNDQDPVAPMDEAEEMLDDATEMMDDAIE